MFNRKIWDSLAESIPPGSRTTVPAITFDLHCGEVHQSNWAVTTMPTASGILVNVSATLDRHTLSEQKQLMQQACDQCIHTGSSLTFITDALATSTKGDSLSELRCCDKFI